ncbi:hypothetical protein P154DRAFT_625106 [Amniculicola lignicola CBS 123094]|uniref:Uncharacterized protein n=1 Tax=Amniculicola lignicola CBS 123094 TaxID=1392246 RepID=A0A6A5VYU3_9PLEO|nr:hypothetical protein P154DRAFT_625106 [Amniculicola lignicola CBS 123094]
MTFRFLDLPAELRIEVHKHCTPLPKQLHHFKDLFTVSKRVGEEYRAEALILLNEFLEKVKADYHRQKGVDAEISLSIKLSGTIQVTVKLPRSLYMARLLIPGSRIWTDSHTKFDNSLVPLLSLYMDELSEDRPNIPLFTTETPPRKLENDFTK